MDTRLLTLLILSGFGLISCDQQGPAERAGERVDEAGENVRENVEDAGDNIEDACEDATNRDC